MMRTRYCTGDMGAQPRAASEADAKTKAMMEGEQGPVKMEQG